jgi:carbonic anhydrase
MSNLDPLLERNQAFARTRAHQGLSPMPSQQLFVVSCIDARVDPTHILGAGLGDALVLRNAGGRVTDEVINEIAFIAALTESMFGDDAPPFEVAVIHHTSCGTRFLADDAFRRSFAARIDADETELAAAAVTDPIQSVRRDVEKLLASPLVPSRVTVSGHVYDVDTGLVETVVSIPVEASRLG